jgi:hypothetical protein
MGISNNPLPVVVDQPHSIPADMIAPVLENTIIGPLPESLPSAATTVQTPTVVARKITQRRKRTTRGHFSTSQTSLDEFEMTQPIAMVEPTDEQPITRQRNDSRPLVATTVIEKLPLAPKKKAPAPISPSPRNRTRSARSTAIAVTTLVVPARSTTPSVVAPIVTQEPPIAATVVQDLTITTSGLSHKRKHPFKGKHRKELD